MARHARPFCRAGRPVCPAQLHRTTPHPRKARHPGRPMRRAAQPSTGRRNPSRRKRLGARGSRQCPNTEAPLLPRREPKRTAKFLVRQQVPAEAAVSRRPQAAAPAGYLTHLRFCEA
ncbi:hypothetical protein BB737_27360 [Mycobacterium avium subsp. hominissuis]|uniref:Uncharacterized protein n=2 Tax=Mycobacterium avium TaxID=1764 RepID=A0A2A3L6X7_MYCAV|nr:hypothetical protein MAV_4771 [Mycobacterium avium 104]AXO21590.1 hypothetical protein DFS55_02555 [Mycobacterium avium subsp. hominissuis]AYJ07784.1 hypothetical protein DBO90_21130 [Mycobacterium avium]ETZ56011.1 hypothetical protein L838_0832 [Mycobacterium avium MAV_120709_2344]TXA41855.1 hypothetical protein DKM27_10930 [Mycobacterium tuberculosis variant bovis]